MAELFTNNAYSTLASGITDSATSITVATGEGARFPSPSGGDHFYATLIDASNNLEIVKCTARSGDTLTVTRAQQSTTNRAYSSGDRIELRITASFLNDVLQSEAIGDTVQGYDADTLKADVSDTLTKGMLGASYSLGNLNSATTLHISDGNIQHATMTGSFTLTAPDDTDEGYVELELTIDATGGYTLTLSGFNEVSGTVDTTASAVNYLRISKHQTNTVLEVVQAV